MDVLCKKKGIEAAEHWNRQRLDKLRLDAMWTAQARASCVKLYRQVYIVPCHRCKSWLSLALWAGCILSGGATDVLAFGDTVLG